LDKIVEKIFFTLYKLGRVALNSKKENNGPAIQPYNKFINLTY